MEIPIYRHWEMDNLMYPKEEIHWRQIGVGLDYTLYYKKEPILETKKYSKTIREKNSIYSETYIDVFDMNDNKIGTKKIKIIHSHNKPEDELPQLGDIVKQQIRNIKIKEICE